MIDYYSYISLKPSSEASYKFQHIFLLWQIWQNCLGLDLFCPKQRFDDMDPEILARRC